MILRNSICVFPKQKANHFLNKSTAESHLPQELIINKEFSSKKHEFKEL